MVEGQVFATTVEVLLIKCVGLIVLVTVTVVVDRCVVNVTEETGDVEP